MDTTRYVFEVIGHLLQIVPAMMLYFLCIPEEMFRRDRERTIVFFHVAVLAETFLRVYIKYAFPKAQSVWGVHETGSALLVMEVLLLIIAAPSVVKVPRIRNMMTVFIVFFWGCAQIMLVNMIEPDHGVFHGRLVLAYATVTLVIFPIVAHLFVRYVQEYLRMSGIHHLRMVFGIVLVLTLITTVHVMIASWSREAGMVPVSAAMSISMLLTYWLFLRFVVMTEREDKLQRHILASQIQPHFIYNTMNTIYGLCDEDTEEAKQAICDFSDYLRGNFESLERTDPIYFRKELEHTRFYLSIEKRRFRNDLNIIIDTPVTDFKLPPLTVQPLAENAIRHGIRKKMQPGLLAIRTRETDDAYEIIIEDDGVGFDTEILKQGGVKEHRDTEDVLQGDHIHVGIANARARIEQISNGTLEVESSPGKGTVVTIKIPK